MEPLGKLSAAESSVRASSLPPASCRFLPFLEGNSLLPMEEAGRLVPDPEGNSRSAARAQLFMYVTFSTWYEDWCL